MTAGWQCPAMSAPKAEIVIDVLVAIEIAELRALAFFYEDRIGIVGAIIAGDAERKPLQVVLWRFGGFRRAFFKSLDLFPQCIVHDAGLLFPFREECIRSTAAVEAESEHGGSVTG